MTKIVFYGASVTQQRNGYVECFAKLSKDKVLKFGFGGMQLSDAGIYFIDKVVEVHPDICFVDWFSTWYMNQDGKFNRNFFLSPKICSFAKSRYFIECLLFTFCFTGKTLF